MAKKKVKSAAHKAAHKKLLTDHKHLKWLLPLYGIALLMLLLVNAAINNN